MARLLGLLAFVPLALMAAGGFENEYVRVVMATDAPRATPGSAHEHKENRVMIYLDSGDIQIKYASGKVENQHWKPGDVAWSPANGVHTSQNVSTSTVRIVEIELRKAPTASAGDAPPDRTRDIIDNSQVRVYQASKPRNAGAHYVAVDVPSGAATWDSLPAGSGPFVIAEMK